jgi:hypothetical protein
MKLNSRNNKAAKPTTKPAEPAREMRPVSSAKPVTTIEAKIDVGFGNKLFLRGEGGGLSWDHGTPLKCVDPQTWQWTGQVGDTLKFKVLLNDTVWAKGEDFIASPGKRVEVFPAF